MRTKGKLIAAVFSIGLTMQFGMAFAMDDMKHDTMGKQATSANAAKKDAMTGDCADNGAMARDAMTAKDGMKKDAMDHAAMAAGTSRKNAGKDCMDGGMKKDAMKGDAMKGDAMKGDAMKGDAMEHGSMGKDAMKK